MYCQFFLLFLLNLNKGPSTYEGVLKFSYSCRFVSESSANILRALGTSFSRLHLRSLGRVQALRVEKCGVKG